MSINNNTAKSNNWQQLWLYQPSILVTDIAFWPTYQMSMVQQLNSLTRLVILVFVILYLLNYKNLSLYVLIIGIVLIIFTSLILQNNDTNTDLVKQSINNNFTSLTNNLVKQGTVGDFNKLASSVPVISHLQVYNKPIDNQNWSNLRSYSKH